MYGRRLSEVKPYSQTLRFCLVKAKLDAMFIPILAQVHHLDSGLYEAFFPEYISDAERRHSSKWHEGKSQNRN